MAKIAPSQNRLRLLAGVHAAAKEAGLGEEARRDLQKRVSGKDSCKDMSDEQLRQVWQAIKNSVKTASPRNFKAPEQDPLKRKIYAMYWDLGNIGGIPDWAQKRPLERRWMLDGYIAKVTKVQSIAWLTPQDCNRVIEGLKIRIKRAKHA